MAEENALESLETIVERLTDPEGGCPWDKEQTPQTLSEYIIEESHELVSAIRYGTPDEVAEEIGDVAFLLVTIAHHYAKQGGFTLEEALRRNAAKMVHRHPHVFAGEHFDSLADQLRAWERIKKEEHAREGLPTGLFDSLPRDLDPLARAYRIHSKASRVGFTWEEDEDVERQVEAEWLEYIDAQSRGDDKGVNHEIGDLLLTICELGRRHGIKANEALDNANERFLSRFRRMEALARAAGKDLADMDLDGQNELWEQAKAQEKDGAPADGTPAPGTTTTSGGMTAPVKKADG